MATAEITTLEFRTAADDGNTWSTDGRDVMVPRYADDTFSTSVDGYYFELYYPGGGYTFGINFSPADPSNTNVQITVTGEAVDIYKFTKAVRDAIDARSEFSATINEADTSGTSASVNWIAVDDVSGNLGGEYLMMSRPSSDSQDIEFHYWWLNVSGGDSDPTPSPASYPAITATGHEVAISTNDTAATVAGAFRSAMSAVSGFTASGSSDSITCTCDDHGPADIDVASISGTWIDAVTSTGAWDLHINTVTVTNATAGAATDGNDGDFPDAAGTNSVDLLTVTVTQQGANDTTTLVPGDATATATVVEPSVDASVTVTSPTASATATVTEPTTVYTLYPDAIEATATATEPSVTVGDVTATVDSASATATAIEPAVDATITITVPALSGTGTAAEPSVTVGNATATATDVEATASIVTPDIDIVIDATSDVAAATGTAVAASVTTGDYTISGVTATATASSVAASVTAGAHSITSTTATATASIEAADVTTGDPGTSVPAASATGSIAAATVSPGDPNLTPDALSATATIAAPSLTSGALAISSVVASATASITAPNNIRYLVTSSSIAAATASAITASVTTETASGTFEVVAADIFTPGAVAGQVAL